MAETSPLAFNMLQSLMRSAALYVQFVEDMGVLAEVDKEIADQLIWEKLDADRALWHGNKRRNMPPEFKGDTEAYRERTVKMLKLQMMPQKKDGLSYDDMMFFFCKLYERDGLPFTLQGMALIAYLEAIFTRFTGFNARIYYDQIKLKGAK